MRGSQDDRPVHPGHSRAFAVDSGLRTGPISPRAPREQSASRRSSWPGRVPAAGSVLTGALIVDPIPAGLWIRSGTSIGPAPLHPDAGAPYGIPRRPDCHTVVVGAPGDQVDPGALVTTLRSFDTFTRARMRLAPYAQRQGTTTLGQIIADALGERVEAYTGLPEAEAQEDLAVLVHDAAGSAAWAPFAQLLVHHPRRSAPILVSCRAPGRGFAEIGLGVYRVTTSLVLETIACGLWLRDVELGHDFGLRARPCSPGRVDVVLGAPHGVPSISLQSAAQGVLETLDPASRALARVWPLSS